MAYTPPGADRLPYCYLVKRNGKESMNIGDHVWKRIFPATFKEESTNKDHAKISESDTNFFKISDILPAHRVARKPYLKFLAEQIMTSDTEQLKIDIEKICNWCGDDDILFVPTFFYQSGCVLTASLVEGDKIGYWNHQIGRVRNVWHGMMSKYRVWKLTHFRPKKSANRQNFILDGSTTTETMQGEYVQVNGFTIGNNSNTETEGETR